MKLTSILLTAALLQVGATGIAQNAVTYTGKNVRLRTVFKAIEKQTGFAFFYRMTDVEKATPVTIDLKSTPLVEALTLLLKDQPLTFSITGKTIVIKEKPAPAPAPAVQPAENDPGAASPPIDVKGRIVNENGEPVLATVTLKGAGKGTNTNSDGYFELKGVDAGSVLIISAANIETRELKLNGTGNLNVVIVKMKVTSMNEIVVNKGYYTEKQRLSTGDVTKISGSEIANQPVNNPLLALQALVPGMQITQNSGLPGGGVTVRIRGQNSINFGNDPLYIIDGVPYTSELLPNLGTILASSGYYNVGGNAGYGNPFSYIDPASIESIDILKDADATAIYGSRGANGVVVITTKKARSGKLKADFNIQDGWGKVGDKMKLLNTRQYLQMRREGMKNDGTSPQASDFDLVLWDTTRNTDWQKVLLGGTAQYMDTRASLTGGNDHSQFLIGAGYHKETTVFPGNLNDQKGFLNFNVSSNSTNKKLYLQLSGSYTIDHNHLQSADLTTLALHLPPDAPSLLNPNGTLNWATDPVTRISSWNIPLAAFGNNGMAYQFQKYNNKTTNLIANGVITCKPFKGFNIKANLGYTNMQTDESNLLPFAAIDPALWPNRQRTSSFNTSNLNSWIIEPQANYDIDLAKHHLSILAGSTIQQNNSARQLVNGSGYLSDLLIGDIRSATTITANTYFATYKYTALFARLNYNYDDKYLINITARQDGTSRFIGGKQFHAFGAVGAGWIFSKETYFTHKFSFLSFGKLRASYGTTGSDQVGDYSFLDLYNSLSQGVPYQGIGILQPNAIYTPELEWEQTKKLEAALELGFFKDRVFLEANVYRNRSSNQLVSYSLPAITGFTSVKRNLPATVQNQGIELILKTNNVSSRSFKWNTSVNLTINRNEITKAAPGLSSFYVSIVGHSLNSNFYYHYLGVDPATGLYQVSDKNGKPTNTPAATDRTVLEDLAPKYFAGIQNTMSYKQWQLDFSFQIVNQISQGYLYSGLVGRFSSGNQPVTVLNRWQKPGDHAGIQEYGQNTAANKAWLNTLGSDQTYQDGSYIRLKNLSLSWNFPGKWQQKIGIQRSRIYLQGQNLLTFTHYTGLDPETRNSTTLPPLRVITAGVQVGL